MNEPVSAEHFTKRGCLPHQATFAAGFFATNASRVVALTAPAESGKTFTAAEIVAFSLTSGTADSILVLAPDAEAAASFANVLLSRSDGLPVIRADRRRWWQLEANATVGKSPWPVPGIIIVAADTLRHDDVAEGLRIADWKMLVLHHLPVDSSDRVKSLFDAYPLARVLCVSRGTPVEEMPIPSMQRTASNPREPDPSAPPMRSSPSIPAPWPRPSDWNELLTEWLSAQAAIGVYASWSLNPFFSTFAKDIFSTPMSTAWNFRDLVKQSPKGGASPAEVRWIEYARNRLEITVAKEIRAAVLSVDGSEQAKSQVVRMARAASSSFYALEQLLLEWCQSRNRLVHGRSPGLEGVGMANLRLAEIGRTLLPLIESVDEDSKLAALKHAIQAAPEPTAGSARVYVYARYPATVDYLHTALGNDRHPVVAVTDRMPVSERKSALRQCHAAGGVVVLTAKAGMDLPRTRLIALYDPASDDAFLQFRIFQFVQTLHETALDVVAFADTTNCLPNEALERKTMQTGRQADDDSILRAFLSPPPKGT